MSKETNFLRIKENGLTKKLRFGYESSNLIDTIISEYKGNNITEFGTDILSTDNGIIRFGIDIAYTCTQNHELNYKLTADICTSIDSYEEFINQF